MMLSILRNFIDLQQEVTRLKKELLEAQNEATVAQKQCDAIQEKVDQFKKANLIIFCLLLNPLALKSVTHFVM